MATSIKNRNDLQQRIEATIANQNKNNNSQY